MRFSFAKIFAGVTAIGWLLGVAHAQTASWQVVVPAQSASDRSGIAHVFASRLKGPHHTPVPIQSKLSHGGAESLEAVLRQTTPPYSLVLMSEELSLVGNAAKSSAQHLSHYATLLVFLETRWCLFARTDSNIAHPNQLLQWARQKSTAPRIAIPVASGRGRLWVQGMAQRTGRAWQMDTYGIGGEFASALDQGTDLALGHCDQQWGHAQHMRILAKGTHQEDGFLPRIPKFSDLGWMPFGNGWLAWMTPHSVPQAEQQAMAQQLYAIARQQEVKSYLLGTEQAIPNLSPQASAHYVSEFANTWNQIGHLLLGEDFGNLEKMQGLAKPMQ